MVIDPATFSGDFSPKAASQIEFLWISQLFRAVVKNRSHKLEILRKPMGMNKWFS